MHFILYLFAPNYSRLGTYIDRGIAEPHRYLERLTHFGMILGFGLGQPSGPHTMGCWVSHNLPSPRLVGWQLASVVRSSPHLLEPFSHTSQSLNGYSGQSWGGDHVSEVEGGEGKGRAPSCVTVRGFWWGKLMESGGERRTSCSASIYKTVICGSVSGRQKRRGVAGWAGSLFSFMTHTQPNCENPLCVETPGQICLRQTLEKRTLTFLNGIEKWQCNWVFSKNNELFLPSFAPLLNLWRLPSKQLVWPHPCAQGSRPCDLIVTRH